MHSIHLHEADPVPLVLDVRIAHDRFGRSSDPSLNGNLHYPNDIDRSLNEAVADKIRKYRSDYHNNPPAQSPLCRRSLVFLGGYIVNSFDCYSYRLIGKLTAFLQLQEFSLRNLTVEDSSTFGTRRSLHNLKQKLVSTKTASVRVNLNIDGAPITSRTHTHPSHSQTSRLLTSSLSLGVPVPRPTECMRDE
jgi:hypothetical protein